MKILLALWVGTSFLLVAILGIGNYIYEKRRKK